MDVAPRDPPSGGLGGLTAVTPKGGDSSLWEQEQRMLVQALERSGQNQSRAARLLKISREQLRTRMKRYGLLPPRQ
jgi:DNA-binding NtrC family response regulator